MQRFYSVIFTREIAAVCLLLAALAIGALVYIHATHPAIKRIHQSQTVISTHRGALSESDNSDSATALLKRYSDGLEKKQHQLTSGTGVATDFSALLRIVMNVAKSHDITLSSIVPEQQSPRGKFSVMPVLLGCNTSIAKLGRFIAEIESMPSIGQVAQLSLSTQKNGSLQANILINLLLREQS